MKVGSKRNVSAGIRNSSEEKNMRSSQAEIS